MGNKKIHLIYCKANESEAITTIKSLAPAGFEFIKINDVDYEDNQTFAEVISQMGGKALLLISDNFLKSKTCLNDSTKTLQSLLKQHKLLPIIVDGLYKDDSEVGFKLVATQLSKMGHIMKYMSYWQEQYLSARRKKRKASEEEKAICETEIKIVKSISNEIADFLKFLKDRKCIDYPAFQDNDFDAFFKFMGIQNNLGQVPSVHQEEYSEPNTALPELANQAIVEGDSFEPGSTLKVIDSTTTILKEEIYVKELAAVEILEEATYSNLTSILEPPAILDTPNPAQNIDTSQEANEIPEAAPIHTIKESVVDNSATQKEEHAKIIEKELLREGIIPLPEAGVTESLSDTEMGVEIITNEEPSTIAENTEELEEKEIVFEEASKSNTDNSDITLVSSDASSEISNIEKGKNNSHIHTITNQKDMTLEVNTDTNPQVMAIAPSKKAVSLSEKDTKTIFVMGATSPIGRAIVNIFSEKGYRIILTGNRFSQLFKMKMEVEQQYEREVRLLPFNPSVAMSVDVAMDDLDIDWQNIDILLNIADFSNLSSSEDSWNKILNTNITALYNITDKVGSLLVRQKKGQIINIATIDRRPEKALINQALQQGIEAFTQTIQVDLEKHNIKVSQLFPQVLGEITAEKAKAIANIIYFTTTQPDSIVITRMMIGDNK